MRYTQPQSGPVQVDPSIGADFAWCALVGKIVGPNVTPTSTSGKAITKAGVGINAGYAVAASPVASMHATTWTECGVVLLDGNRLCPLSARGTGQTVLFDPANIDLVMWGVADVNLGGTVPTGIVHYVAKRDGNTHTVWLNGKLFGTASSASAPAASTGILPAIGAYAGSGAEIGATPLTATNGVLSIVRTPKALSDAQCLTLSRNHWQLFRSPQRVMMAAAGPDVIVALTGQATTAAAGTISPSNAIPVTGSSGTAVAGSVSVGSDVTVALAGQAMTASRGTLAPGMTKALTGQASSAQQGLLTPARAIVISGQSGAASAGTIGPGTVAALTGQASATQQGVVATSGNKTVALTGQSASVAQGALTRSTPEAVFALATIMRQSAIAVQAGTMKSTVAAQGGTIKATIALSTIMRQSQINTRATMTNAPINRTVAFI